MAKDRNLNYYIYTMKSISNELLRAISAFKFDSEKPVLNGAYINGDEFTIADGLVLHTMKNREDTGLKTILNGKDLAVANKAVIKKQPFSIMENEEGSVVINGVKVKEVEGDYPSYQNILKDGYTVSTTANLKLLINALQVIQKMGAYNVEIAIEEPTKPIVLKGRHISSDYVEEHVVSVVMPVMPAHERFDVKVKGVEQEPEPVKEVVDKPSDPDDEDLPF